MFDLDLLLTLAGLSMAAIGVGVLLLGKPRHGAPGEARRNVFEAFGIKLDVANPSVLLIMFGVVLMLTPRFLPLNGEQAEARKPADVSGTLAEVLSPPAAPAAGPPPADEPVVASVEPIQPTVSATPEPEPPAPEPTPRTAAAAPPVPKPPTVRPATEPVAAAVPEPAARVSLPREATAVGTPAAPPAAPEPARLLILTEALAYEGESVASLRDKLHGELRTAVKDVLGDQVAVESGNPAFRDAAGAGDLLTLCKRTRAGHLLLADLTPVAVESFTVESANWPNMRYAAVACGSGRVWRSDEMRMEPTVGDRYPLQQSVARSARDFIRKQRHLLR